LKKRNLISDISTKWNDDTDAYDDPEQRSVPVDFEPCP